MQYPQEPMKRHINYTYTLQSNLNWRLVFDLVLQVKYFCGPAKWNPRAPSTVSSVKTPESQEVWNVEEEDLSTALLTSKLTKFSDPETAVRVRGLFSDMAQSMCTNYTTTDCWNGRTVGEWVYLQQLNS